MIDVLGLNDWTVARTPPIFGGARRELGQRAAGSQFDSFDADGDGLVTEDEVRRRMQTAMDLFGTAARADELLRWTILTLDVNRDGVIERTEALASHHVVDHRIMAHDRHTPDGYVEGFRPNVKLPGGGRVIVYPRSPPLTDAEIREHEGRFRRR